MTTTTKDVCVIGGGATGLVASKVLHGRGITFDCFEKGSGVGGLWRHNNDSGQSAAYRSLHINSSRTKMAFSDFDMPADLPDFPHHSDILNYLESYVDHFHFRQNIQFSTTVQCVRPVDGHYEVVTSNKDGNRRRFYNNVIVANGHHWSPRLPKFPGHFNGCTLHSFDYDTPEGLEDKRVLVVGIGNSGCDICCEVSRIARRTLLSTRSGAHIIPKYLLGKPLDRICPPWIWNHLPLPVFQLIFTGLLRLTRGNTRRFGLPQPRHRILEEHPTVSSDLLNLIGHGRIHVVPNIQQLDGDVVEFSDGRRESIDVIIYATGYHIRFPFLDSDILDPKHNEVPLYRRVVHPDYAGFFFPGLVQPWGPVNPLSEAQAEWIADLVQGTGRLPSVETMRAEIESRRRKEVRRYGTSARHTIQVDFHPYLKELRQERRACQKRSRQTHSDITPTAAEQYENRDRHDDHRAA